MKKLKAVFLLVLIFVIPCATWAVPAKQGVMKITQADGTELRVRLRGDELHHIVLSEDEYLLVEKSGIYYFADISDDQKIVASPFRATNIEQRTSAAKAFVEKTDRQKMLELKEVERQTAISSRRKVENPNVGLFDYTFPTKEEVRAIVILVEYQDVKFKLDDPYDYFTRMMQERGFKDYGGTGCVEEYFEDQSMGVFQPKFDVYGPVTLAHDMEYYGGNDPSGNDKNPQKMVIEACQQLDEEIDFNTYDTNNDHFIDNVFLFYAGKGEASGGTKNSVWPHSWDLLEAETMPYYFDGVRLNKYACSNEWMGNSPDGIGTFCHEFSHVMGLPDLYATTYTNAFTPGEWDLLDTGSYNNNSRTPPGYSIFERYALDWIEPMELDETTDVELYPINESNEGCIIKTGKDNEFFLLENRQKTGWDKYIPGHGMLIWHIDYNQNVWSNNIVNNNMLHQYVDIEEADNKQDAGSRAGDAFPGTAGITSFSDDTKPSMKRWDGTRLNHPISDIEEVGEIIRFNISDHVSIGQLTAVALPATDITESSFTANWEAMRQATGYLVSVFEISQSEETTTETCDFTGGIKNLPEGWTTNAVLIYTNEAYCGESAPSLRMGGGNYLCTPDLGMSIGALRFWARGFNAPASNNIQVFALEDESKWTLVGSYQITNEQGGAFIYVDALPNTNSLKITYNMVESGGALAIDDVEVIYGNSERVYICQDLWVEANSESDIMSKTFTGLKSDTRYTYSVKATDGSDYSKESGYIQAVTAADPNSISLSILSDERRIYNLQGHEVTDTQDLPHGIYIIERRGKIQKVIY